MKLPLNQVDSSTRDYLDNIWKTQGKGCNGVFVRQGGTGAAWGVWLILLGLVALGAMAFLTWAKPWRTDLVVVKAGLAGVGMLFLLLGVRVYRSRASVANPMGKFVFVDALFYWEVTPSSVNATPIDQATDVEGTHRYSNRTYQGTDIVISQPGRPIYRTLGDRWRAADVVKFVNALVQFRKPDADPSMAAIAQDPKLLSAIAVQLIRGVDKIDLSGVNVSTPIPYPTQATASPDAVSSDNPWMPWLAAIGFTAVAFLGFAVAEPAIHDEYLYMQIPNDDDGNLAPLERYIAMKPPGRYLVEVREIFDERLFAKIQSGKGNVVLLDQYVRLFPEGHHAEDVGKVRDQIYYASISQEDDGNLMPLDQYLENYPGGRYAEKVRTMRDDRRFNKAKTQAQQNKSPLPFREYLADQTNYLHRQESQQAVNKFYDEAIDRLKDLKTKRKDVDPQLFQAVVTLLETLKGIDTPDVLVVFRPKQEPEPSTKEQKDEEKDNYNERVKEKPELRGIETRLGSAILPLGQVFSDEHTHRREKIILDRLRESMKNVLAGDIITLTAVDQVPTMEYEARKSPVLEVAYHTKPSGTLFVYTTTTAPAPFMPGQPFNPRGLGGNETVNGLLRGYSINWIITVRPSATAPAKVCVLGSRPANRLSYTQAPGDPEWATYAIILCSAFYDMSDQIIRSFALDPPAAKTSFRFSDVSGN